MALPTRTVVGNIADVVDQDAIRGAYLTFTPSSRVTDSAGNTELLPLPKRVDVDSDGSFTVDLPINDAAGATQGFTYAVDVETGARGPGATRVAVPTRHIAITSALVNPVQWASLTPVPSVTPSEAQELAQQIQGKLSDTEARAAYVSAVNVEGYGAVGDGVANDTPALISALSAAASLGVGQVFLPRGTYRLLSQLNIPSGVSVAGDGAVLDFRTMPDGAALGEKIGLSAAGSIGAPVTIGTAIGQWSRTLAGITSTAGLAAGDLVLISNDEPHTPGSTRTDRDKGELNVIQSVDSASQVTLVTGSLFAYGTTGLKLQKVTPVEGVTISGLRLLMGGVGSVHSGIRVQYGRDVRVLDVTVDGAEDTAVSLGTVWDALVSRCRLLNATSSATLGNTGYGVAVVEGSRYVRVESNYFDNCRHFVAGGGYWPTAFVEVVGNQGQRSLNYAYDCHEPCFYWRFAQNTATGCVGGFTIRGQHVTVEDNLVVDSTGRAILAYTYDGVNEQVGVTIRGNRARKCAFGIEVDGLANGAGTVDSIKRDVVIADNDLRECGGNPILLRHFDNAEVSGNSIVGSGNHAINVLGLASGTPSTNLTVARNRVKDATNNAYRIQYVNDIHLSGGEVINAGDEGVLLDGCTRSTVIGLLIRRARLYGIRINAGAKHNVSGVTVTDVHSATGDGIRVVNSADFSVTGSYIEATRNAVNTSGTDRVIIVGNNGINAAGGNKFVTDAAAVTKVVANNIGV